jgi:hypothetical protein
MKSAQSIQNKCESGWVLFVSEELQDGRICEKTYPKDDMSHRLKHKVC